MITNRTMLIAVGWIQVLSLMGLAPAIAQAPQGQQGHAVAVALVPRLQDSTARVVVIRRAQFEPREIILLRGSDGTPADLMAGIALLQKSRAREGNAIDGELRMTVRVSAPIQETPSRLTAFLSDALERLHAARFQAIPEVGTVRAITLSLARFSHRGP